MLTDDVAMQAEAWYTMSLSDVHYHGTDVGAAVSVRLCWSHSCISTAPQRTWCDSESTCNRCITYEL